MATLCRQLLPFTGQDGLITRHARYAMISPTRRPSCLRLLASSFCHGAVIARTSLTAAKDYSAGSGSGFVTGGAFSGDLLGGAGSTGSAVGDTGSSKGTTV